MSTFAIIKTGGKQYTVKEGSILDVEKLEVEDGSTIDFDQVLLVASEDGSTVTLGSPTVKGAKVSAKVLSTKKGEKVHSVKFRHKTHHVRTKNHRQIHTKVKVEKITA
ncbi:MAG: 50S ribosomal protein L21 [Parcubacteria group bacterium]|nr:50S ribosomal protein L21 [Parcubacteria group bacterium]